MNDIEAGKTWTEFIQIAIVIEPFKLILAPDMPNKFPFKTKYFLRTRFYFFPW